MYADGKSDLEISEATTDCRMLVVYDRTQRTSMYAPATFGDIPQEVLGESLIYLVPALGMKQTDLVSASLVCRAWYPVAIRLIVSKRIFIGVEHGMEKVWVRASNTLHRLRRYFVDWISFVRHAIDWKR